MASSTADLTEGGALQQYVIMSKNTKGKACTALIQQALGAPNVYVFGELLEMPNIQQLAGTEEKKYLDLLKIFAYGTFTDYKANASQLPELNAPQARKLKQLTIVSLSTDTKVIPYSILLKELDIQELRELEDLIIDASYQGIILAKLDQKHKQLEVEFAMGRDTKPEAIDNMLEVLTNWGSQSTLLLQSIKEKINHANFITEHEKKHKEDFEKKVENVKQSLKAMEADMLQELDNSDFFDDRSRKGRSKMKGHPHHPQQRDRRGMF